MKRQYELLQVGDSNIIAEGKCIYTGEALAELALLEDPNPGCFTRA